jgi:eukaryotic-like serine/threonine-protein kinase
LSNSPTLSDIATKQGIILGTAAYMSPEQSRGKPVDKRADIWAFGCVLFELLTGGAAFAGKDVTDILAAVIRSEPDWSRLPSNLHWRIKELLERCLEKEARDRFSGMSDVRVDIQKALADPGGVLAQPFTAAEHRSNLRTMTPWVAAAVILTAVIAGLAVWKLKPVPPSEPRQVMRSYYDLPERPQFNPRYNAALAVSPDGKDVVYSTSKGLYIRSIDDFTAKPIAGTEGSTQNPFFSPDGKSIGYFSDGKLKKIALNGGSPVVLCAGMVSIWGAWWNEDNTIAYSQFGGDIMKVSADEGPPESIIKIGSEIGYSHPQILPDGKSVMYTSGSSTQPKIMVQSIKSGAAKELFPGYEARYLPTGHIVYMLQNSSNLYAIQFDPDRLEVKGVSVPILEGVRKYAVSASGTLAYMPGTAGNNASTESTLVWVDRDGNETPLSAPPNTYWLFSISPDRTRVALTVGSSPKQSIRIWDLDRETMTPLTLDDGTENTIPFWTPDGKRILYTSSRGNIVTGDLYWKAADGTGTAEKLAALPGRGLYAQSFSRDGKTLVLWELTMSPFSSDIGMLSMDGGRVRKGLLQEKYLEMSPRLSPDGRWLAYVSDESKRSEVYVRPFPEVDRARWPISTAGGYSPLWSPDGRELFYRSGDAVMAVRVETEPAFNPGKPTVLFRGAYYTPLAGVTPWDISPDGKRFLMLQKAASAGTPTAAEVPSKINVVVNWLEELKQKAPVK